MFETPRSSSVHGGIRRRVGLSVGALCVERGTLNVERGGTRGAGGAQVFVVSPVPLSPTRPNAPAPQGDCILRGRRTKEAPLTLIAGEMPKMHGRVEEWARRGIEFLALPNGVNKPMSLRCDCRTPNGCKGTPGSVHCVWAWTNGSRQLGVGGRQTVALRPRTPSLPPFSPSPTPTPLNPQMSLALNPTRTPIRRARPRIRHRSGAFGSPGRTLQLDAPSPFTP